MDHMHMHICFNNIQTVTNVKLVLFFNNLLRIDAVTEQLEHKNRAIKDITKEKLKRLPGKFYDNIWCFKLNNFSKNRRFWEF